MRGFGWGMSGSSWIIMILFWGLIILGIIYLLRNMNNNNDKSHNYNNDKSHNYSDRQDDNAVNIAKKRYAKGEISKEELDEILDDLKQS